MSEKGLTLDWVNEFKYSKTFLLIVSQTDDLLDVNEEINIDQQMYFLTPSLDLYEKYTINSFNRNWDTLLVELTYQKNQLNKTF